MGQTKGRLWHVTDTLGQGLFTVFADTLQTLHQGLFEARLSDESILFRKDPMQLISRRKQVSFHFVPPNRVFEKRKDGLMRMVDGQSLNFLSDILIDSIFCWKSHLLVRSKGKWLWNPGNENELWVDSISMLDKKLILWAEKGLIFLMGEKAENFIAYPSSGRVFNPVFTYILSDSLWLPLRGNSNPMKFQQGGLWWNDSTYLDFAPSGVHLQSPALGRIRIGDTANICSSNFLLAKLKKQWWVLTSSGKRVKIAKPFQCKSINDSILAIKTSKCWKLIFQSGNQSDLNKTVTEPGFFQEGLLLVKAGKRYGFVDLQGFIRIACRYDTILHFVEGFAAIRLGNQWGFLDKNERIAVQPHFQEVTPFKNGLSAVRKEKFWGLINTQGIEILPFDFDQIIPENESGWKITRRGWVGFANSAGYIVIQTKYSNSIEAPGQWHLIVRNQRKGIINPNGKVILPVEQQQIIFVPTQNLILYY